MSRWIVAALLVLGFSAAGSLTDEAHGAAVDPGATAIPNVAQPCGYKGAWTNCVFVGQRGREGKYKASYYAHGDLVLERISHRRALRMVRAWRTENCTKLAPKTYICN